MKTYDVIVVGGGPAGASAAKVISDAGFSVLLLEKQREVAKTVQCAEGISKVSLVKTHPGTPKGIATTINKARVYIPSGDWFEVYYPEAGYILERKIFDRGLVQEAVLSGAKLKVGTIFKSAVKQNGKILLTYLERNRPVETFAKLVIGADGPSSSVGKSLGLNVDVDDVDIHKAHQFYVAHPEIRGDRIDLFFGSEIAPGGYGWVFPKTDGFGNIGVGVVGTEKKNPREYVLRLLDKYFPGYQILGETAGIIPTGGMNLQLVGDRVMLAGDAGRLADPISGGGIPQAMESGTLAGITAVKALRLRNLSKDILNYYPEMFWRSNKRDFILSTKLRDFFLRLTDEDMDYLGYQLKRVLHQQQLDSLDGFAILKRVFVRSPMLFRWLTKKGFEYLEEYIRTTILR